LGSIFLNYFVRKDPETGSGSVDWEKLEKVTRMAVRFLDDVIEVNPYTLPQIRQTSLAVRRIGLGVGGWADLLVELGIPYDSDEALSLAEKLMDFVNEKAKEESCKLAQERGPFPLWQESIYKDEKPRRNSTVTTIAPTGSISIIANASSGIEPLFAIAYRHIVKDKNLDRTLTFFNPRFERLAKEYGVWDKIKGEVAEKGTVRGLDGLPDGLKDIFATAHEIAPEWHIKMQAAFQKHTDNAVSKTINLERTAEVSDVSEAYLKAWETGCKGITVFRDGCKDKQVLNLGIKNEKEKEAKNGEVTLARPFKVAGATYKLVTPVGTAFITINEDEQGEPLELFINIGKAGSDLTAIAEALGRTISTALRFKGYLSPKDRAKEIAFQLGGIGGRRSVGFGHSKIRSLPDAVSVALSTHFGFGSNHVSEAYSTSTNLTSNQNHSDSSRLPNGHSNLKVGASVAAIDADPILASTYQEGDARVIYSSEHNRPLLDICPSCGANAFVYEEGCSKCQICGYSEC
jgi:ribonucleoside-diphosphate reductase alpha chain